MWHFHLKTSVHYFSSSFRHKVCQRKRFELKPYCYWGIGIGTMYQKCTGLHIMRFEFHYLSAGSSEAGSSHFNSLYLFYLLLYLHRSVGLRNRNQVQTVSHAVPLCTDRVLSFLRHLKATTQICNNDMVHERNIEYQFILKTGWYF